MIGALRGEALKLATNPATWIASVLVVLLPAALAGLNGRMLSRALTTGQTDGLLSTDTVDEGFGQLTFGLVGVAVLGVSAISSEYTRNARTVGSGRQIATSLVAVPRRGRLLVAKLAALTLWLAALAALAIPATIAVSRWTLGEWATPWDDGVWQRCLAAGAFWMASAWLAFGVTCLLRNGIVPMALLITNASMVSFSLLAAQATPWARYLPDLAAYPSFLTTHPMTDHLSATTGMVVLGGWVAVVTAVGAVSFLGRDA